MGYGSKPLGWTIVTTQTQAINQGERIQSAHASLHGLVGSMTKEYPNWKVRLLDLEENEPWPLQAMFDLPEDTYGNAWAHRGGQWYRQRLLPCREAASSVSLYKMGGVYVVIGGAGGIGETWSDYMIRTYEAQIIWIGRRPLDDSIRTRINELGTCYIEADASDRDALQAACTEIKQRFSRINGVIHSVIVLMDQTLAKMDEQRFRGG